MKFSEKPYTENILVFLVTLDQDFSISSNLET